MIDLSQYWLPSNIITKIFLRTSDKSFSEIQQIRPISGPNGIQAVTMAEYDSQLNWLDTWFLGNDPILGVIEYKDTYPNNKQSIYASGYYGQWGSHSMAEDDIISGQLHLDPTQSIGVTNNAIAWGWQTIRLTKIIPTLTLPAGTYENIAVIEWHQYWITNATGTSAKEWSGVYYLAPGLGTIRMDWILPVAGSVIVAAIV